MDKVQIIELLGKLRNLFPEQPSIDQTSLCNKSDVGYRFSIAIETEKSHLKSRIPIFKQAGR